jgi:ankyrin repeat protein
MLIENGANVNGGDANMNTALHWAAFKNNDPCVMLLLKNGANVMSIQGCRNWGRQGRQFYFVNPTAI